MEGGDDAAVEAAEVFSSSVDDERLVMVAPARRSAVGVAGCN